jgi:hypothetical protein
MRHQGPIFTAPARLPNTARLERLHAEILRHIGRLERGENSAFLEVWHLYYPEGTEDFYDETCVPEGL